MFNAKDLQDSDPPKTPWWQRRGRTADANIDRNLAAQFNGKKRWNGVRLYRRPRRNLDQEQQDNLALNEKDYGGSVSRNDTGKFVYTNQFGQTSAKYSDVAVYLSPTNFTPRRLIVQATDSVIRHDLGTGDWRRTKLSGDVPTVLIISEWAMRPFHRKTWYGRIDGSLRVLIVSIPVQILVSIPFTGSWDDEDTDDTYKDFPGYHWQWAKHAINPLDEKPHSSRDKSLTALSWQMLLRPRRLVVQQPDQTWRLQEVSASACPPYIFISFANQDFLDEHGDHMPLIERMSERAALEAGCQAYWLDFKCRSDGDSVALDSDIYSMCDVIRGSTRVVIMLKDDKFERKLKWGSRMWTLPEALLAPGHQCFFCHPKEDEQTTGTLALMTEALTLVQISTSIWRDEGGSDEYGAPPTRLLAEHFSNQLTLSRLELFSLASTALWKRSKDDYKPFTRSDVAYALMGLLHYRIRKDKDDTEFQSLAQLSLRNDSDRIVERMISLYPKMDRSADSLFSTLDSTDQFHTRTWDIQPTCQVVGVAHEDNTVLVDSCRAMHIRWKGFPRPVVVHDTGFRRLFSIIMVSVATFWLMEGISLAIYYAPLLSSRDLRHTTTAMKWTVAAFLFVAVLLCCFAPGAVRRLYGGRVLQSTSSLVGFEGVMPIEQLEHLIFGQNNGRLSYEASSAPYAEPHRDERLRIGKQPRWVSMERPEQAPREQAPPQIPPGHRLFTLVDTGELSVTIFSAERPPTVALLCGREGGMLRAVLCSWQFENDCLYKEAVLRMPTNIWDSATPKGWLKLCLKTLNQARDDERGELERRRDEKEKEKERIEHEHKEQESKSSQRM